MTAASMPSQRGGILFRRSSRCALPPPTPRRLVRPNSQQHRQVRLKGNLVLNHHGPGRLPEALRAFPRASKLRQQSRSNLRFRVTQTKGVLAAHGCQACTRSHVSELESPPKSSRAALLVWLGIPSHCVYKIAVCDRGPGEIPSQ